MNTSKYLHRLVLAGTLGFLAVSAQAAPPQLLTIYNPSKKEWKVKCPDSFIGSSKAAGDIFLEDHDKESALFEARSVPANNNTFLNIYRSTAGKVMQLFALEAPDGAEIVVQVEAGDAKAPLKYTYGVGDKDAKRYLKYFAVDKNSDIVLNK